MMVNRLQTPWRNIIRLVRRYREVIVIVLTLLISLAFLAFGYAHALSLESQHPSWFTNGQ